MKKTPLKRKTPLKAYTSLKAKTPLKAKSPIKSRLKPYSKKRICVSKQTYKIVFDEYDGKCALCGTTEALQYHHILYRSEAKHLIDDPTNGILLCMNCHKLVHRNKKLWQPKLLGIKEFQTRKGVDTDE